MRKALSLCKMKRLTSQTLLTSDKVGLNSFQMALAEETIARRSVYSAPRSCRRQVLTLKAENMSLKKLDQDIMQKAFLVLQKNTGKMLDRLSATVSNGMLEISLKVDQRLASWLAREVSELCPDNVTFTPSWHNHSKQSYLHTIQNQNHGISFPYPLSYFLPRRAPHFSAYRVHRCRALRRAVNPHFPVQTTKLDVASSLRNGPVLLRIVSQSISDS